MAQAEELKDVERAVTAWFKRKNYVDHTERDYRNAIGYVTRGKSATLGDLPRLLGEYREKCKAQEKHRAFNLARSATQALLKSTFHRYHRLYQAVGAIEPLPVETREKPDITVEKAREVAMALGKNGAMWWAMCITGMNPKEYWGPWRVESDRIRIFGTKRAGRRRSIPLLWVPVKPHITREGFKTALQKTKLRYTPKNGRDAFAQWMEEVGLPESRRKAYMGHGKRTMTDIYTRKDVSGRLEEDAETLRDYIGENYQQLQVMK